MVPWETEPEFAKQPPEPEPATGRRAAPRRKISTVTGYALGGYTLGTALATIVVWILAQAGVDATDIEQPLGYVLQALGVAFGGWAAPPHEKLG